MTEPASLPFFVGVDPAYRDDVCGWTIVQQQPDGRIKVVDSGTGPIPDVLDLPRDQWSETK